MNVVVLDVGGMHISGALVKESSLELHGISSVAANNSGSQEEILGTFEELIRMVLDACRITPKELTGLSFGIPNPFDYQEGVSQMQHKYAALYGVNLRRVLAKQYGIHPNAISFVNDASAFLLGESYKGAGVGATRLVGITLGTGIGSAFMVGDRIVSSGEGIQNDGYLWNFPWEGSIVEDFISTHGIQSLYQDRTGDTLSVLEIAQKADISTAASDTMQTFGRVLGTVLKKVCAPFRPEVIVIGGAIARSSNLFLPSAIREMEGMSCRLEVSKLFDHAALVGAGVAWLHSNHTVDIS